MGRGSFQEEDQEGLFGHAESGLYSEALMPKQEGKKAQGVNLPTLVGTLLEIYI